MTLPIRRVAVLGDNLAEALGKSVGDTIELLGEKFRVIGITKYATVINRGASPLSSDGRRLTISPSRRARIKTASGCASGSNADGVITTRAIGLSRLAKSRITSSMSSMPPSTGTFRIDWPRSAIDGDNTPTGHSRVTAPLSST